MNNLVTTYKNTHAAPSGWVRAGVVIGLMFLVGFLYATVVIGFLIGIIGLLVSIPLVAIWAIYVKWMWPERLGRRSI